jgi:hypothetical protein
MTNQPSLLNSIISEFVDFLIANGTHYRDAIKDVHLCFPHLTEQQIIIAYHHDI